VPPRLGAQLVRRTVRPALEAAERLAPVLGLASEVGGRSAPLLLLSPTGAGFLAGLPHVGRVASPWASGALRTAGQAGTAEVWPYPYPE
jgi:hypothetical protein